MTFRHDPLVGIGIFHIGIKSQMPNTFRAVTCFTVVRQPIQKFFKYIVNKYILIISEHWATNFVFFVRMNVGMKLLVLATGPGLECKRWHVQFQHHPQSGHADSWRTRTRPVPMSHLVSQGLTGHIISNLQLCVSGFTGIVRFRYTPVNHRILTLVHHSIFSPYWPP